jgi:carboxyl-terminal processing protease
LGRRDVGAEIPKGVKERMGNRRFEGRTLLASILFGMALGSAFTFIGLWARGVAMEPDTNTPAFRKFYAAYRDLHDRYYKPVSEDALINGAIQGMAGAVQDKFTDYFTPEAANQFHDMLSSSFVGIGVMLQHQGKRFVIVSVIHGSPAAKAGLHAGDIIERVNGVSIEGMSLDKAAGLILGPEGSKVVLKVSRPAEKKEMQFSITRARVSQPTVSSRMLPEKIGYLRISIVANHTASEVKRALDQLRQQRAKGFILDLRDNVGGYVDQAVQIASDFIPKGKVILMTQDRSGHRDVTKSSGPGMDKPVVVLMNENTASAAEILAGALHEDISAPLVGTKSFGKGTAQETEYYPDGSALKYTVEKWLTPDGHWIHGKGLTPDYPQVLGKGSQDSQLQLAEKIMRQQLASKGVH